MASRTELSRKLHDLFDTKGVHIYFQPTENTRIVYPAIIYSLSRPDQRFADNGHYLNTERYLVKCISTKATTEFRDLILDNFIHSSAESRYISNGYYIDPINLYY